MDQCGKLCSGIEKLLRLKGKCYFSVIDDLALSELSLRQLDYLRKFNSEGVTTTYLAEILDLSKPTVTEMVKKFIRMDLVYKQSCVSDKRVYYVKLTKKGQNIVDLEKLTRFEMSQRLEASLSQEDLDTLAEILNKIE